MQNFLFCRQTTLLSVRIQYFSFIFIFIFVSLLSWGEKAAANELHHYLTIFIKLLKQFWVAISLIKGLWWCVSISLQQNERNVVVLLAMVSRVCKYNILLIRKMSRTWTENIACWLLSHSTLPGLNLSLFFHVQFDLVFFLSSSFPVSFFLILIIIFAIWFDIRKRRWEALNVTWKKERSQECKSFILSLSKRCYL